MSGKKNIVTNKEKNIVLVGFMGTGKTSAGRRLARILSRDFVDTDVEIERVTGLTVAQIFIKYGEIRFRSEEALAVKRVSGRPGLVIATGGGSVLRADNLDCLKKNGVLVDLHASPQVIQERIGRKDTRPLLKDKSLENIEKLLRMREPYYLKADIRVDTTDLTLDQTVEQILHEVRKGGWI